ncbi:4-hydroxybenzoate 3-monooxygenase [Mycobacterium aquaticum]|uniref:4-hydroxybenzoate 3-monooxygenase n=1 Tax=Mycobacterium aquaticum TaxID=1927124 RepID=A0A1X0ASG9_9MYCO|nr:4-hydroxybenzoate 3-monooxygenase [Mycobacterium aquaticum]ORA32828.1 4-hydroxybenzoate 3-monooxygenase [Mycobacterium aquaticum]
MSRSEQDTVVVIIGAGVAGLTLGNFLLRNGIDCVVLEKRSRKYVEQRQRAGSLDGRGVRMFREWGLAEVIEAQIALDDFDSEGMPLRIDGQERIWRALDVLDDEPGIFCPQQVLVSNLIEVFLRDGGDLRFEVDVALHGLESPRPTVRYRDAAGTDEAINCDFVAGCDGYRGISRQSIPAGILTSYSYEHGYAWLAFLSAVPADPPAVMAVHSRGFAAQITRGPNLSRFYLQCPLTDAVEQWPDKRIWSEVDARFGRPLGATGPITDKQIVPLRNVVHSPMRYGALYLLGDAAHLVSPMSAKGMSLALYDAEVFARAATRYVQQADSVQLENYSQTCLRHIWDAQVHAVWITNVMHDAGDSSYAGEFRKRLARAELERMMSPVSISGN